jgi:hypothetical protein
MSEPLQRRALLGFAVGVTLSPWLATEAADEPIRALHLGMIVPSSLLPGISAFERELRGLGYEEVETSS